MKKLIAVFLCVFCPVVFAQSKIDVPVIENSLAIIAGQEGSSDVIQRIAENYALANSFYVLALVVGVFSLLASFKLSSLD